MSKIVHARLDEDSRRILHRLHCKTGWRDSKIIRNGLKALAELTLTSPARRIIGLAKFKSRVRDLGSNKEHLRGFGRA